jgi:hypothetical protein
MEMNLEKSKFVTSEKVTDVVANSVETRRVCFRRASTARLW